MKEASYEVGICQIIYTLQLSMVIPPVEKFSQGYNQD